MRLLPIALITILSYFAAPLAAKQTPVNLVNLPKYLPPLSLIECKRPMIRLLDQEMPFRNLYLTEHKMTTTKHAIVIGASVGMGRELAKMLATDGYEVGLAARRGEKLRELQREIPTKTYVKEIDAANPDDAGIKLQEFVNELGGIDLIILSITGYHDVNWSDRTWQASKKVIDVDVMGFYALARTALTIFEKQGYGHLVGFSSVDGLRGVAGCPVYSAAKAFCSRYMEAERNRLAQKHLNETIFITDLVPGWVDSKKDFDFAGNPKAYWVETLEDACRDIFDAIKKKEAVAYITRRWKEVADLLKVIPDDLYNALGGF